MLYRFFKYVFNVFKTVNMRKIEHAIQAMNAINGPKTVRRLTGE